MKRAFLTFIMAVMLTASLAACTATPTDTNHATGNGNGGVTDNAARNRSGGGNTGSGNTGSGNNSGGNTGGAGGSARGSGTGGSTMSNRGRYYANDDGDVFGGNDGIGSDIGRAAGDMMNGMGNAAQGTTR